jgi:hypothetical protein
LREFEKIKISSKAIKVIVNNKEENSEDFCLDFVQEFGLWPMGRYKASKVDQSEMTRQRMFK